jgi:hypothetical protein
MAGQIDIETVIESVLVWLAQGMERFNPKICNTTDYFNIVEINNARKFTFEDTDESEYYVFKNAFELAPKQYSCVASIYQLGMLRKHDMLKAIPEVQRESKEITIGNEVVRTIIIDKYRIKAIANLLAEDTGIYYYNEIRLNLDNDGGLNPIQYNPDDRTITIKKDDFIIIPDGNHRSLACEMVLSTYPDRIDLFKNRYFNILFTNESIVGAKRIFAQECNRAPILERHQKAMERSQENILVDMIISHNNADPLYGNRIVKTGREIKNNSGYILFESLSNSIKNYYNIDDLKTQTQKEELINWLVSYFNEITYLLVDDLSNYKTVKKVKWSVDTNAWFLFTALSSRIRYNNGWKNELKEFINKIDWNIEDNPYSKSSDRLKNIIKTTDDILDNYFESTNDSSNKHTEEVR